MVGLGGALKALGLLGVPCSNDPLAWGVEMPKRRWHVVCCVGVSRFVYTTYLLRPVPVLKYRKELFSVHLKVPAGLRRILLGDGGVLFQVDLIGRNLKLPANNSRTQTTQHSKSGSR